MSTTRNASQGTLADDKTEARQQIVETLKKVVGACRGVGRRC
jgi:hypothetical protein